MQFGTCNNEVKQYLDTRYVSACESVWHLFHFLMHCAFPNIVKYRARLKSDWSLAGSDGVRQKGLGFNL
jgi:hypothetical protein